MKKILKILGCILGAVILLLGGYLIYLFASYHRIPDNQELTVETSNDDTLNSTAGTITKDVLVTDTEYSALTYNIGFGAYTPDFSFFMDGGKSSWAKSKESVLNAVQGAGELAASYDPDFAMIEEVDLDSTRSYHVDEYSLLKDCFPDYYYVFAQNYDSAFLFYPFTQPHGKSRSGIGLFSRYPVTSALRRSFPVSTSFTKFFDLDRCYSISRIPVENGKELVIFALHMSAYGNSDEIRKGQIGMLAADMKKEYEAGNYVLCGGDFNHDLKASEDDMSEKESWAYPFPREELPEHFSFGLDLLPEEERRELWNSARNADMEYVPDVILAGAQYFRGYILDVIFAGVHFSFSGYFCACGKSGLSFMHNIIAITLVRIPGVYLTSRLFPASLLPMGLATAAGSLLSVIICVIAYTVINRKKANNV